MHSVRKLVFCRRPGAQAGLRAARPYAL